MAPEKAAAVVPAAVTFAAMTFAVAQEKAAVVVNAAVTFAAMTFAVAPEKPVAVVNAVIMSVVMESVVLLEKCVAVMIVATQMTAVRIMIAVPPMNVAMASCVWINVILMEDLLVNTKNYSVLVLLILIMANVYIPTVSKFVPGNLILIPRTMLNVLIVLLIAVEAPSSVFNSGLGHAGMSLIFGLQSLHSIYVHASQQEVWLLLFRMVRIISVISNK